jgi:uncharacterized damage-inducible protein DinB
MIDSAYVVRMARSNGRQSRNLYGVAGRLSDSGRRRKRRAFCRSIHGTFNHLFNHQTHQRGQVHCMLARAGERPDDTDLPFMLE